MRLSICLVLLTCGLAAGAARAEPNPAQAAYCVAALKARAEPLADRVRQGDTAAEAALQPVATASFSFIGTAYKQGIRQPHADDLVSAAQKQQAGLSPAELARAQDDCQAQGERLYAQANVIERQLVSHAVSNRIARLRKTS